MIRQVLSALAVLAASTAIAHAAPAPVTTTGGALQGVQGEGVTIYRGIPYAAPPVGDLRWRPPQPPAKWQGVKLADHFGDSCMQNAGGPGGPLTISEDCLYLNVWTPAPKPAGKLPVMVWIHGGGFNLGSSSWKETEGSSLARRGVVLVSLNYRLGKFGFFAHPALTRESPSGELGNYGVMDMIAALKWVKANISRFGGDPGNVTIFGESAGGMAVNMLMESPDARGLFHRAIVESGGGRNPYADLKTAEASGQTAAEAWGVKDGDAAALRAIPAKTVLGNATMTSGGGSPMIDGKVVPEPILAAFQAGHIAHVPYVIGTNAYEAGVFPGMGDTIAAGLKSQWDKVEAVYDGYGTKNPVFVKNELATDSFMTEPARALAREAARHGLPTWVYYFSYLRPSQRDGKLPGPLHFDEVYVVFDSMMTSPPPKSDDKAAVGWMGERWTRFARTGNPGGGWPAFKPGNEAVLEFANDGPVARKDFAKARLDFAESVASAPPAK